MAAAAAVVAALAAAARAAARDPRRACALASGTCIRRTYAPHFSRGSASGADTAAAFSTADSYRRPDRP